MVVYEIENMITHDSIFVQSDSERSMIRVLIEKGFTEVPGMFLAGYNAEGQEISAMESTFLPVGGIISLPKKGI